MEESYVLRISLVAFMHLKLLIVPEMVWTAVIRMEGGSDLDLTILDQPADRDEGSRSRTTSETVPAEKSSVYICVCGCGRG